MPTSSSLVFSSRSRWIEKLRENGYRVHDEGNAIRAYGPRTLIEFAGEAGGNWWVYQTRSLTWSEPILASHIDAAIALAKVLAA